MPSSSVMRVLRTMAVCGKLPRDQHHALARAGRASVRATTARRLRGPLTEALWHSESGRAGAIHVHPRPLLNQVAVSPKP